MKSCKTLVWILIGLLVLATLFACGYHLNANAGIGWNGKPLPGATNLNN